ncbi:FAD/NAD(P)-binding domain-containing protein [Entomophthora muscae]|uniref:FAD/NAD(P)-binding domain-containing protein n=1 Tax=Entomophthora muscae TaxID=34485 RepID=A0ACC2SMI9_9FUNG|nr:FAD/NAD(P)-binding domain-containing protein [Entomophthora muscae]
MCGRVAIIGAGVAGPAMALVLKKIGMVPTLYEAGTQLKDSGAGFGLAPNGLRMLDKCISHELYCRAMEAGSHMNNGFGFYYSNGTKIHRRGMDLKDAFGYPIIGLRRHRFRELSLEQVKKEGIPIVFGSRLIGLESTKDIVKLQMTGGKLIEAEMVIGCDGIHSATRHILFGQDKPTFTGIVSIIGLSEDTVSPKGFGSELATVLHENSSVGTYPLDGGKRMWFTKEERGVFDSEDWTSTTATERMMEQMRQQVGGWMDPIPEIISKTYRAIYWGIFDRPPLTSWHSGRVVLVGDACHPMAPHLGQGANTSLEDVAVLVKCLDQLSSSHPSAAFQKYQDLRKPRTTAISENARNVGKYIYSSHPIGQRLRDPILRFSLGYLGKHLLNPVYGYKLPL